MTTPQVTIIQQFARTMPCYWQTTTRRVKGAELLDMGYTQWEEEVIDADRIYHVKMAVVTNQVRRLVRLYQTKGAEVLQRELDGIATQLIQKATAQ